MYKKSEKMKLIRQSLESGNCLGVSIRNAGVRSETTVARWRERPLINRYFIAVTTRSDNKRNGVVVDALLKSAAGGNVAAIAIWLKFKMGWKESYDGPPINVHTQIWNGAVHKQANVDEDGRILNGRSKDVIPGKDITG